MGLDSIEEEYAVGVECGFRDVDFHVLCRAPDAACRHFGANGTAHGFFRDAVVGNQRALAFVGGTTVASHGRHYEGLGGARMKKIDRGTCNLGDVLDSATTDCDSDTRIFFD